MKVTHSENVESERVTIDGAEGCRVRWLIGEADGAPHFAMRQFEIVPGGHTPRHQHPFEHEVFVLEGNGVVCEGDVERPLMQGDIVYVQPGELHQFRNTGDATMKFLCLIPIANAGNPPPTAPECGIPR